jgi:hypothetical protein
MLAKEDHISRQMLLVVAQEVLVLLLDFLKTTQLQQEQHIALLLEQAVEEHPLLELC